MGIGRQKVQFINAGASRTYQDYVSWLKSKITTGGAVPKDLFLSLSDYSKSIDLFDLHNNHGLTCFGIATACYGILTEYQPIGDLVSDGKFIRYFDEHVTSVVREAEGVKDDFFNIPEGDRANEQAKLSLTRLVCEAGVFQYEFTYKIANNLILSGLKSFGNLSKDHCEVDRLFQKYTDLSAHEYIMLLMGAWVISEKNAILNLQSFTEKTTNPEAFRKKSEKLFNSLAKDHGDYKRENLDTNLEKYSPKFKPSAYFSRWPLIKMSQDHFACVGHPFMRLQLTSKYISKALSFAREDNPEANGRTVLADYLGKSRLEPFFKELCNIWNPPGGHYDEYPYVNGAESADRIIFEKLGGRGCATHIQLKLKSLTANAHFAVSLDEISKDFSKSYSDCVFKSLNFLFKMEQAVCINKSNPDYVDLNKKILEQERHVFIGISPDVPPIFSLSWSREILMAEVLSKIAKVAGMQDWFQKKFPAGVIWHIMDLADFQIFLSTGNTQCLADEIADYILKSKIDDLPMGNDGSMPASFRTFIINKYGENDPRSGKRIKTLLPQLQKIFIELKDDLGNWLFKSSES